MIDYFAEYERWKSFLRHIPREGWDASIENLEWLVDWALRLAGRQEEQRKAQEPPKRPDAPDGSNSVC